MDNNKNQSLFRPEALKHLHISHQLNERLKIASKWSWLPVGAISIFILFIIIWGFWGSIPTRVPGRGILLASQGNLYNAVAPEGNGRMISIAVKPGDLVNKNQIIAHLDEPDLHAKIEVSQDYLNKLQLEFANLKIQSEQEIKINSQQINDQNNIFKKIIASELERLKHIQEFLDIKNAAFKRGLVTKKDINESLQNLYETKKSIEQAENGLSENQIKQSSFVIQWKDKLKALELKVADQAYQTKDLQVKLAHSQEVRSPISGIITSIQASIGEKLEGGQVVATISPLAKNLDAIIYVPAQDGKRVKKGMEVLIVPTTVKKEEFGSIRGIVQQVSLFPSAPKTMLAVLQNDDLVKEFSRKGTTIAVRASLTLDSSTMSGYAWTSSQGPDQMITAGTLVEALITVRKQSPISLIIPAFKKLLGE